MLVKEATGLPLINSFHTLGRVLDRSRRSGEPAVQPIRALTEDEVVARSDAVVAATPHEVDDLVAHYGADVRRLRVSPPGVDHTVFGPGDRTAARARIGLGDEPTVLFVGRIQAQKGIDIAIDAMAKVPERVRTASGPPQLVIVGGPSGERGRAELRFLHRLASDRELTERIRFIPARPHDELTSFYRAADVLVMPSRSETFGLVAAEAQACGLPVIASDVGGLRYVVRSGVSGRIVQTLEPADFAHALVDVLDDPGERTRLAAGAVRNAVKFSWPSTARRLLGVYGEVGRP